MLDFKKLFTSVADASLRLIGKKFVKKDLTTALQLCNDLISFKGVACDGLPPRLIPGIFTDVQKYSTLGNLRILNLNCVGLA